MSTLNLHETLNDYSIDDLKELFAEHKTKAISERFDVSGSTVSYYRAKANGVKRQPSIKALEQKLANKQARAAALAQRKAERETQAGTDREAKAQARAEKQAADAVRRAELLEQIAAL